MNKKASRADSCPMLSTEESAASLGIKAQTMRAVAIADIAPRTKDTKCGGFAYWQALTAASSSAS